MKRFILAAFACVVMASCTTGPTPEQLAAQAKARAEAQRQADEAAAQERAREEAERAALAAKEAKAEATERQADEAAQSGDFQKALDIYATALSDNLPSDITSRLHDKVARTTSDMEMAKIRAIEKAGDDAAQSGNPQKAVNLYTSALHAAGSRSDAQQEVREKIAKYVSTLAQVPELPEDAKHQAIDAQTRFKSGNTVNLSETVSEMQQVMLVAPWWTDGYFNLGLMQERAGQFGEATVSLKLYLLAAPNSSEAEAIKTRIGTDATLQQALAEYQQQSTDESAEKVIKVAMLLDRVPAISEDARKHFVRGSVMFKDAKSPYEYEQAMTEFKQASDLALWWPEARYNLALACEGKGDYARAISNLNLYQLFKLSDAEARQTQDKVYAVQAKMEQEAARKKREEEQAAAEKRNRIKSWEGSWTFPEAISWTFWRNGSISPEVHMVTGYFKVSVDASGTASGCLYTDGTDQKVHWYGTAMDDKLVLTVNDHDGMYSGRLEILKSGASHTAVFSDTLKDGLFNNEGHGSHQYTGAIIHSQ